MEALKLQPGQYTIQLANESAVLSYSFHKGEPGPHRVAVLQGVNGSSVARVVEGANLEGVIASLRHSDRVAVWRKLDQIAAPEKLRAGIHSVEKEVAHGLSIEEGGIKIREAVGRFVTVHRENLTPAESRHPDLVPVAPVWRLDIGQNSLVRPWRKNEELPEPYGVWYTHRNLIEKALVRRARVR